MAKTSSSSSSSFSFLVVLSVFLVVANNLPTSHGITIQLSQISVNQLVSQIPSAVSGNIVDLTLITGTVNRVPLLVQSVTGTLNAVTRNLLVLSVGGVAPINLDTTTIINQVPALVCNVVRNVNLGPILFVGLNVNQVQQIITCLTT
ncbi:hypothetical protein MKW94_018914 [Papaver nudicaule]|uniref:Uncharacterized protein n=1 Tax=Papaver nudicaule TaxID=74823 RepID=A0AA41VSG2_PAPNU|nr:hypothetical protein [Papaver nudicaule]